METACPSRILVYGDKLFLDEWERLRSGKSHSENEITLLKEPVMPDNDTTEGTAYVDLENKELADPNFIRQLSSSFDKLRVVGIAEAVTDDETIEIAKMGVSEILTPEQYQQRVSAYSEMPKETIKPVSTAGSQFTVASIIGNSPKIMAIKQIVDNLSDVDYPNAILFGDTGTGKDLLAKVMHYTGVRRDKHFTEVNCSAIPDELFESELFGHTKGAFTGAKSNKTGLFEFADNGTIFLDEIGNLSMSAQAKLLKILENRKLRPLGSVAEKDINVRVIAATNVDLEEAVRQNRFREDLLFRLNLIAIHLPPLRERKEDIPELALFNFDFYRTLYNKPDLIITDTALKKLANHNWPGNVRELRNVIERTILLCDGKKIGAANINTAIRNGRVNIKERRSIVIEIPEQGVTLKAIERQVIGEILNLVDWNRSEAARILGISRARLRRIMEDNNLKENRRSS